VSSIYLQVLKSAPHCPPYLKLRDNAHISKEEWQWLIQLSRPDLSRASPIQIELQQLIASGACMFNLLFQPFMLAICCPLSPNRCLMCAGELFKQLGIHDGPRYRLYDFELIELNKDVTFILLLSPIESFLADVEGSVDAYRSSATLAPISKRSCFVIFLGSRV
jgi:hypothetical protein